MSYIENIYICLAAPLFVAVICMRGRGRVMMTFTLAGMTVSLFASYINTFLGTVWRMDTLRTSIGVAPMVEEIMKFLPVLFFLLVFEPRKEMVANASLMVACGFATFENVCYLTNNGAGRILHLLIRGFGTGAMHVVSGLIVALGLMILWDRTWLRVSGTFGLICGAMCYHGIYNVLVSQEGTAAQIGYVIPLVTVIVSLFFVRRIFPSYHYKDVRDP